MMNDISFQLEQSGYDELTLAYATALQKHNVSILSLSVGPIKGFENLDCGIGKLALTPSKELTFITFITVLKRYSILY